MYLAVALIIGVGRLCAAPQQQTRQTEISSLSVQRATTADSVVVQYMLFSLATVQ